MKSPKSRILPSILMTGAVIALLATVGRAEANATPTPAPPAAEVVVGNSMPDKQVEMDQIKARYPKALTVGASDLRYIITAEGDGKTAEKGSTVSVHYRGTLWDGTVFDSSYERGQPIQFKLGSGRVIKGWDMGIEGMRVGETRILIIPYSMAYGAGGRPPSIPQRAPLIFDVELVGVN